MTPLCISLVGLTRWDSEFVQTSVSIASGIEIAPWRFVEDPYRADVLLVDADRSRHQVLNRAKIDSTGATNPIVVSFTTVGTANSPVEGRGLTRPVKYAELIAVLKDIEHELHGAAISRRPTKPDTPRKKEDSPSKIKVSQSKKDASLIKKKVSPNRKQASTTQKAVSANKTEVSPNTKEVSATQKAVSTNKKEVAPSTKEVSSTRKAVSANQTEVAPNTKEVSPTQKAVALNKKEVSATAKEVAPNKKGVSATTKEDAPNKKEVSPPPAIPIPTSQKPANRLMEKARPARRFVEGTRFVGLVKQALRRGRALEIKHPVFPTVRVFPQFYKYLSSTEVTSMEGMFRESALQFSTREMSDAAATVAVSTNRCRSIGPLIYSAALYGSEGRLVLNCSLDDKLQLINWPDFDHVPHVEEHKQLARYMLANNSTLAEIASSSDVRIGTVIEFCNACEAAGIVRRTPATLSVRTGSQSDRAHRQVLQLLERIRDIFKPT